MDFRFRREVVVDAYLLGYLSTHGLDTPQILTGVIASHAFSLASKMPLAVNLFRLPC